MSNVYISKYNGSATILSIPTTVNSVNRVTTILSSAFKSCTTLTSIKGDSIKRIETDAFYNCSNITTVSFPQCEYIGSYAFEGTSFLSMLFASSSCCIINNIFYSAAYEYYSAANYPNVTAITPFAFCAGGAYTASFPNCTYIGSLAFGGNLNPPSEIYFPKCSYIGVGAFWGNNLSNWSGMNSEYFTEYSCCLVENSTGTLLEYALRNSISLLNLSVVTGVRESALEPYEEIIGEDAPLTMVSFPNCSFIGTDAFNGQNGLTTAYFLSTSFVSGGWTMFDNCESLESIYVPASMVSTYKTMSYWSNYASLITEYIPPSFKVYYGSSYVTNYFEEGMTWEDWVNSSYNDIGYTISGTNILNENEVVVNNITVIETLNPVDVSLDEEILLDGLYDNNEHTEWETAFSVDGDMSYGAFEYMTWEDWINSCYNSAYSWTITNNGNILNASGSKLLYYEDAQTIAALSTSLIDDSEHGWGYVWK